MTSEREKAQAAAAQKVLVVDDQPDVREALRLLLKSAGYAIDTAESPAEALQLAAYQEHDLIILDMNFATDTTSGEEGLRLIDRLHTHHRDVPVVAMTGWSTIELAVDAMRRGACDFVPKPWDNKHFLSIVRKHINSERVEPRSIEAELALARKVQRKLLPQSRFSNYGLECECATLPARDISGDLYDFLAVDGENMAFVLGDVSGKGIGAALLVANLQATIRAQEQLLTEPSKVAERVNRLFFQSTRPEHFATLFFGAYSAADGKLRYVNCGHPSPVLLRSEGGVERLNATATLLGAFQGFAFREQQIELSQGDRVVLFSDGFSEASGTEDVDGWAESTIKRLGARHQKGLAGVLANESDAFGERQDDITVMTLRVC